MYSISFSPVLNVQSEADLTNASFDFEVESNTSIRHRETTNFLSYFVRKLVYCTIPNEPI